MKIKNILLLALPAVMLAACKDSKSYNELLDEEDKAVNSFLANQKVELPVPANTVFETGENAPYYRLDEEGNVYIQVINTGDRKNNKAETGENIYFRYSRIDLKEYETGADGTLSGNQNTPTTSSSFYFNDYTYSTSYNWGTGLQMPLYYLGVDCEVNLLIKSQYGVTDEISMVMPFVYHVKYYRSKI